MALILTVAHINNCVKYFCIIPAIHTSRKECGSQQQKNFRGYTILKIVHGFTTLDYSYTYLQTQFEI